LRSRGLGAAEAEDAAPRRSARPELRRVLVEGAPDLRWLAVIAWATLIFALSGTPSLDSGLGTWDLVLRKAAHVTEYAILGFLLARVLSSPPALLAGVAYAASDELHQHFVPGRVGSP
jgi:VanZ family protein